MRTVTSVLASATLALVCGCPGQTAPARPQWKVYLATDAPVPQLGQQVFIQVLDGSGNVVSSRLIDGSSDALWPISFGIVSTDDGTPPGVRAHLYRLDETGPTGGPVGSMLIDATATLPALSTGINETALVLAMACFGVTDPTGTQTCNPTTGALDAIPTLPAGVDLASLPQVGSWPSAAPAPCSGPVLAGMVCAPGGVFILGSNQYFPVVGLEPVPEHLVQLGPFAIDEDEVSVGTIRTLVNAGKLTEPTTAAEDTTDPGEPECQYLSNTDSTHDQFPVNCISWSSANEACTQLGKRLPTEAEWEYVAGGLGLKLPYPWGADPSICNYAVVASGREEIAEPIECLGTNTPGPRAQGTTVHDIVESTVPSIGGQVLNMGGNVSEWVADVYDAYSGPCWQQGGSVLLVNPRCQASVAGTSLHSIRGGSWQYEAFTASVHARDAPSKDDNAAVGTGFRCAITM